MAVEKKRGDGERGVRERLRSPTRAGYRQVIALMRQGCGPEEILARLRMRPARLREITAGACFRRIVELERLTIDSTLALRLSHTAGKAVDLLATAAQSGKPYIVCKAALAVVNLATRPLRRLSQRRSGLETCARAFSVDRMGDLGPHHRKRGDNA